MPEIAQIFSEESCMQSRSIPFSITLLRPNKRHVWTILGPFIGYCYKIFAFICLKWLKFSLKSHVIQKEDFSNFQLLGPYLGHNGVMFWLLISFG